MSVVEAGRHSGVGPAGAPLHQGAITKRVKRRAATMYWVAAGIGAFAFAFGPAWAGAAGVGLWFPGAGFLLADGWAIAYMPLTLILFAFAFIAWFWAGMVIAPVGVWLTSAGLAALTVTAERSWRGAAVAAGLLVLFCAATAVLGAKRRRAARTLRAQRHDYLPRMQLEIRERAAAARSERPTAREMTDHQLAHLRTYLNIAFKPYGDFSGYNIVDQFQPAAVRYQINQIGYTLAMSMAEFTPNFHGYLAKAQRNLIEQYLHRRVWQYWRYENAWGNFSLNPDPAVKDNIMLTGFYGLQVALYTGLTNDERYTEEGGLTFKLDDRRQYRHSLPKLIDNIMTNFEAQPFSLYPCEPNWIYTACNFRGLTAVSAFDRAMGTDRVSEVRDTFRQKLTTEFMTADAGIVALRSAYTGISVPFPVPDSTLIMGLGAVFPDLAEQYWAFVRKEVIESGPDRINVPVERSVDFGNYKMVDNPMLPYLLIGAQEMGDYEVAQRVMEILDESKPALVNADGSLHYDFSVLTDASLLQGRLMRVASWADLVTKPLSDAVSRGPLLDEVSFPEVLVASATSDGEDLRLVLASGTGAAGMRRIGVQRLTPHAAYDVEIDGRPGDAVSASSGGSLELDVPVADRTRITITPGVR